MYLNKLLYDWDILFLQEHWLSVDQLGLLANPNADYFARGICGFVNSEVLKGRPYGGCGILYKRSLNAKVVDVQTDSNRICAVHFVTSQYKLMLGNVYMPFVNTEVESDEYILQLELISELMDRYPDSQVILGGDWNVDFSRNQFYTNIN